MRSRVNVESVIGANDDYSVSDGSKSYRSAIEVHLGGARHVLDRFHVVRWFTDALTLVRRDLQRREPAGIEPAFDPELFRARFLLFKRADTLNTDEQARLDRLFDTHPRLKAGWDALQQLHGLYLANDRAGAPCKPWTGSPTSTPQANCLSTTASATRSSPGVTRSSTGKTPDGHPTAESKEPTTSYRSYAGSPTDSPTPTTLPPEDSS